MLVVVVGRVVVVEDVLEVVVPPPVTATTHPVAVTEMGFEFVSKRLRTVSPTVVLAAGPTALNVGRAMLTIPVGPVRLVV